MAIPRPAYAGPHCPRCRAPLAGEQLHDGANVCLQCLGDFEARVFHPSRRSARVLQLAQSGPEGAISCANHARNAAVAACDRCGLLICSLCQLDVDGTKLCPSCFDRVAQESAGDAAHTRFRDYGSLAGLWAFLGLGLSWMFLGIPFGLLSTYFCIKAFRNRESRSSLFVVVLALSIALLDILLSALLIASLFQKTK